MTSLPVSFLYTDSKVGILCSTNVWLPLSKCTFMSRDPSSLTRNLLPTISAGYTKSSRIASCTAVNVRLLK